MTAIYGKNFCRSAKDAFFLLMRNVATVVVLDKVTDFLLFMGKMVIVGGVAVGSYYVYGGKIAGVHTNPISLFATFLILLSTMSLYILQRDPSIAQDEQGQYNSFIANAP